VREVDQVPEDRPHRTVVHAERSRSTGGPAYNPGFPAGVPHGSTRSPLRARRRTGEEHPLVNEGDEFVVDLVDGSPDVIEVFESGAVELAGGRGMAVHAGSSRVIRGPERRDDDPVETKKALRRMPERFASLLGWNRSVGFRYTSARVSGAGRRDTVNRAGEKRV
jgi:hypothetical protein